MFFYFLGSTSKCTLENWLSNKWIARYPLTYSQNNKIFHLPNDVFGVESFFKKLEFLHFFKVAAVLFQIKELRRYHPRTGWPKTLKPVENLHNSKKNVGNTGKVHFILWYNYPLEQQVSYPKQMRWAPINSLVHLTKRANMIAANWIYSSEIKVFVAPEQDQPENCGLHQTTNAYTLARALQKLC